MGSDRLITGSSFQFISKVVRSIRPALITVGLKNATCEKRTVSMAELERMTDEIEQNLQNSLEREITTDMVGEQVMDKLREVDEVAYVRFASVYRQFKDIHTFMAELAKLLEEKP